MRKCVFVIKFNSFCTSLDGLLYETVYQVQWFEIVCKTEMGTLKKYVKIMYVNKKVKFRN